MIATAGVEFAASLDSCGGDTSGVSHRPNDIHTVLNLGLSYQNSEKLASRSDPARASE